MKVAILYIRGVNESKQQSACLNYIEQQHWDLRHVIPYWSPDTAVALVVAGAISVVVAACFQKTLTTVAADIGDDGEVWYVHPVPTRVRPPCHLPSVRDLIRRLRRRGETTREIAAFLEIDSGEIRRIIRGDMD